MIDIFTTGRPAGDILSRVVRITLAGQTYELPVLTIGGNKRWKAGLEERLSGFWMGIGTGDDLSQVLATLSHQVDDLLDLLISYDTTGVLPSRETLEETVYEFELLPAVREVWRAANPLVVRAVEEATPTPEATTNGSSDSTSSPPRNGAGRPRRSKRN